MAGRYGPKEAVEKERHDRRNPVLKTRLPRNRLDVLLSYLYDAVNETNIDGILIACNPAAWRPFGDAEQDLRGNIFETILSMEPVHGPIRFSEQYDGRTIRSTCHAKDGHSISGLVDMPCL